MRSVEPTAVGFPFYLWRSMNPSATMSIAIIIARIYGFVTMLPMIDRSCAVALARGVSSGVTGDGRVIWFVVLPL